MPLLKDTVKQAQRAGWYEWQGAYHPEKMKLLKSIPGCHWDSHLKRYFIPADVMPLLEGLVTAGGMPEAPKADYDFSAPEGLEPYPYQIEGAERILTNPSFCLSFDMRLGKSVSTILAMKNTKPRRCLIVCPAIVRQVWADELDKWWTEHPEVALVESGKDAYKSSQDGISIVSYELLGRFVVNPDRKKVPHFTINPRDWDWIVLDESQYAKNPKSQRGKFCGLLRHYNPQAKILMLTGTPIMSEPQDLWHQLEIAFPSRFGTKINFLFRYCGIEGNEYGKKITGINPIYVDELQARLLNVSMRVTKSEVRHILPPSVVQAVRIKSKRTWNPREISETLGSGVRKQHELDAMISAVSDQKEKAVLDLVVQAVANGETHICVGTYLRRTAEKYAEVFANAGHAVTLAHGGHTTKKRHAVIDDARVQPTSILVCTMSSLTVGISLKEWTTVIVSELYYLPGLMTQWMDRFPHVDNEGPPMIYLPILLGSIDEPIAEVLQRRINDSMKLYKAGGGEGALHSAVTHKMSNDEAWSEFQEACEGWVGEGYL